MSWWKNLSIKIKSMFAVSVIIVVTSLIFGVYFLTLYSISKQTEKLNSINNLNQSFLTLQIQHLQWVNTLSNYIINPESGAQLNIARDPAQCGLGKWYYSEQRAAVEASFPGLAEPLRNIEQPHKALHATAATIENLKKSGNIDEIAEVFSGQTLKNLREVEANLTLMQNKLTEAARQQVNETTSGIRFATVMSAVMGAIGALAVLLLIVILVSAVLKPIAALVQYARKCRDGEEAAAPFGGTDELGTLAGIMSDLVSHLGEQLAFSDGVLKGMSVPCSIFSAKDETIFTNQRMINLIERDGKPEDFKGMSSGEYIWGDPGKATLSSRALKENKPLSVEMEFTTHKGNTRNASVSSAPFYNKKGKVLGTVSVWMDTTEAVAKQHAIEANAARTHEAAASATDVAHSVSTASVKISAQVEQSNRSAREQRDRVEQTVTAMNEMSSTALEMARSASKAAETAGAADKNARQGAGALEKVQTGMQTVEVRAATVKTGMDDLGKQVEGISAILGVITDIADQTNLLALNAAIEAARAGEAGRGFAVVADEVRKLAEKTMQATHEVSQVITAIQAGSKNSISSVDSAAAAIDEVKRFVNEADASLSSIVHLVEDTAGQIQAIATAAEEQTSVTEEINSALGDINNLSVETSLSMEESAKAVEELTRQAETLSKLINRLKGE